MNSQNDTLHKELKYIASHTYLNTEVQLFYHLTKKQKITNESSTQKKE